MRTDKDQIPGRGLVGTAMEKGPDCATMLRTNTIVFNDHTNYTEVNKGKITVI